MSTMTRFRAGVTVAAVAGLALLGTATSALACTTDDTRANPVAGNATTCAGAHLPGTTVTQANAAEIFTFTGGTTKDKYLTIEKVADGVTVEAIVVKGGDGYNVYEPGQRGLSATPRWEKLRSPLNRGGQQAQISHWFACIDKTKATETTKPAETTPRQDTSTPAPDETTSAPASAPSTTEAPSSTSAAVAGPAGSETGGTGGTGGQLANTGFDNAWLIWVAGLLIVAGGGLLALLKFRRRGTN